MSTNAEAETATAKTTVEEAPVIPGREEVLKHFAREAAGQPEEVAEAKPAQAAAAEEKVLSQPESEVEAETPPEEAPDETPDEDEELRQALPPEVQEKIDRRIAKEVARRKTETEAREAAEAKLAELESKMAETPEVPAAGKQPALNEIHDTGKLGVEKTRAKEALTQARDLMFTLEDDPGSVEATLRAAKIELKDERGVEDFSPARMKKFLRGVEKKAEWTLTEAIPERAEFLKQANEHAAQAMEFMPELKDPKHARAKIFQQVLRDLPQLQQVPKWPLYAVLGVLGRERFDELTAAKKTAAAPAKPKRELPVTIPQPKAAAPVPAKGKPGPEDVNATTDKILGGDKKTRLDYIKSLLPKT